MLIKPEADAALILDTIMQEKGLTTDRKLARHIGIVSATLKSWRQQNTYNVKRLLRAFPDLSPHWLITGQGPIYAKDAEKSQASTASPIEDLFAPPVSPARKPRPLREDRTIQHLQTENEALRHEIEALKQLNAKLSRQLDETHQSLRQSQMTVCKLVEKFCSSTGDA